MSEVTDNKKILLVEDDLFLREIFFEAIKNAGYNVETAKDGPEAFEKIKQGGWDLILLDVFLPEISGIEIMKQIKNEVFPSLNKSTIFLTNVDSGHEVSEMKNLGIDYWLKSELTPGSLVQKIKTYLN